MGEADVNRVLVVEDELDVQDLVAAIVERAGLTAYRADDGVAGLREFYRVRPDLVILDVMMPELDGWAVLERIRELSDVPVIMLSARTAELDAVRGLRAGADDYLTKPFGRQELLARVEGLLRRRAAHDPAAEPQSLHDALLEIDFGRRSVRVADSELELTPTEFKLITAFARHPRQVLDSGQLLELAWGGRTEASPDQVKLYVSYLRRKLRGASGAEPIKTIRGFGYRYDPD